MTTDVPTSSENWKAINERSLLLVLAAIQFTTIVDFLIVMPLGPQYMRVFAITPGQFGLIVSAYAISAGISGMAAVFFLDLFDRKWALLGLYQMAFVFMAALTWHRVCNFSLPQ
jgi:predicted MFS family arabinose efflux permease